MKALILCMLVAVLAASSAAADTCPGSASALCVASTCPAGAPKVGPRRNRPVSAALIQNAINALPAGTVICVRPATYVGQINFGGKPLTLVSIVPLGATLSGGGVTTPVVFNTNEGSASVLDGFRITGGNPGGAPNPGAGGGIFISDASPTIKNCLVTGNQVTNKGAERTSPAASRRRRSAAPASRATMRTSPAARSTPPTWRIPTSSATRSRPTPPPTAPVWRPASAASPTSRTATASVTWPRSTAAASTC